MPQVNRKKTRKLLFQELFAWTFTKVESQEFYDSFYDWTFTFEIDEDYSSTMKEIIKNHEWFFIYVIEKYSPKFNIEKMNTMNILPIYIALAEIFYMNEEIPLKSSVNEAIELAKVFSNDSSKKIVNGVLNKVIENQEELEKEKANSYPTSYSIFK